MSDWECGVCSYVHKESKPPETCPACEAPEKMFFQQGEKQQSEGGGPDAAREDKQWRCSVSGYMHTGTEPPENCPVCEATADMFEEVTEAEKVDEPTNAGERRWQCTVCGYIHTGEEPPEKCPVCDAPKKMFVEIDAEGKAIDEPPVEESVTAIPPLSGKSEKPEMTLFNKLGDISLKLHLHPITVHFPNGVLPAVVLFLGLSVYFNIVTLETAAYYNLVFVLAMLPVVLLTGYIEWQKRYKGIKTAIFITKIICSLVVLALVNVLVFWRLLDPGVLTEGSPSRFIYLGVAVAMLGAAGIAGHLGGKLVFGSRGD